ncbi:SHOCT domain-containing protein [Geodermatophilus sp. SYSU D00804]
MAEQLRPDIAAAAARMSSTMGRKKEIRGLAAHLWPGERVEALAPAVLGTSQGLLALTDRRVLFVRDGWGGSSIDEYPLLRLGSILWDAGVLTGKLTVQDGGRKVTYTSVPKADGGPFVDQVRAAVSALLVPPAQAAPADPFVKQAPAPAPQPGPAGDGGFPAVVEQLRQLAELRDAGVITIADFEAKKAELLARI